MTVLSSNFYSAIVCNSTDLISVIDCDGIYAYVGDSVKAMLGYEVAELIGKSAFGYIHPDDLAKAGQALQQSAQQKKVQVPPFRFLTKNGQWRWLQCTITNMLDNEDVRGYVTNSIDITDTMEVEFLRDYHQAYYKSLFFEHPDAVFTLDSAGIFQQVNRHVAAITGFPEEETIGHHFVKFLHPQDLENAFKAFEKVMGGEAQTTELRTMTPAGEEKVLSLALMPVSFRGQVKALQGIARDVTAAKRAEQRVKEQAEQLNKIIESITDPFFALNDRWEYLYANSAYASFVARERQELIGKAIWELFPETTATEFFRRCHEVACLKTTASFEETYTDGQTISYSIFPADGGVAVHFADTTAERTMRRELEKLSLVASKTTNGVVIMNPQGQIEWVNDGFVRLTGYSREEAMGQVPSQLLQGPGTDPETAARITQKYKDGVQFSEEVLNFRKNGEKLWFAIDVTPIYDSSSQLIYYIAIETDINDKKAAEAEQKKLTDDLFKHNRDLQQFTYIVSHNLRAPVANAMGLSSLVRKLDKKTPLFDKSLDKLEASVKQLDHVIKDINHILSLREYNRHHHREEVNLLAVCQQVLASVEDKLQHMQAQVTVQIDATYSMPSSKAYLYSILYNLVSNAIKYSAASRDLELHISVEKDLRGYVLTVSDNGLGMDMRLVETQLFKLYKRFHPNTHGKGMGLFLVKTQVEALGGKIKVQSAPDQGTTFYLYLGAKHV